MTDMVKQIPPVGRVRCLQAFMEVAGDPPSLPPAATLRPRSVAGSLTSVLHEAAPGRTPRLPNSPPETPSRGQLMLTAGPRFATGLQQEAPRRTDHAAARAARLAPVLAIAAAGTPACGLEVTTLNGLHTPAPSISLSSIIYFVALVWLWGFLCGWVFSWLIKSWLSTVSPLPATGKPTQPETAQPSAPPECAPLKILDMLTCDELRALLRTRNLSTTGVKAALTTRLATHLSTKFK